MEDAKNDEDKPPRAASGSERSETGFGLEWVCPSQDACLGELAGAVTAAAAACGERVARQGRALKFASSSTWMVDDDE